MTTTIATFQNDTNFCKADTNRAAGTGPFPAGAFVIGNGTDPGTPGTTGPVLSASRQAGIFSGWEPGSWPARWIKDGIDLVTEKPLPAGARRHINLPRFIDDGLSGSPGSGWESAMLPDAWLSRIPNRLSRKLERQLRRFLAIAWRGQLP